MTQTCPSCGCHQGAGLLCHAETAQLERALTEVPALVAELEITLTRQARIGGPSGSGGLARERGQLHTGAMAAADDLSNVLTTWARDLSGDTWRPDRDAPQSPSAALWLLGSVDAIRRHPAVVEIADEVADAVGRVRRVIDRPADRTFLGPCTTPGPDGPCTEDLYARPAAVTATCSTCGAEHDVADRRAWLLQRAADQLVTVREAARMLGTTGQIPVTEASIRGHLHRGRLTYRADGTLLRLGDLLDILTARVSQLDAVS